MNYIKTSIIIWIITLASAIHAANPPSMGVVITCPYMPYSATSSQIIYLTNSSADAVAYSVTAFDDDGNLWDLGEFANLPSKSVTKVAPQIAATLIENGFTGGRLCLRFEISSEDVSAYFSYNVGGTDRAFVSPHRELIPLPLTFSPNSEGSEPVLGLKTTIPYMPYSVNTSQIISIANPSTVSTEIFVTAYDDQGVTYDFGKVGLAPGQTVTELNSPLRLALELEDFTTGKITFEIDCDNPEILVYSSYNTGGSNRGYVAPIRKLYQLPTTAP